MTTTPGVTGPPRLGRLPAALLGLCLLLGVTALQANDAQYEAAREAMQAPPVQVPAPPLGNALRPPDDRGPASGLPRKWALREAARQQPAPPVQPSPTQPAPEPSVKPDLPQAPPGEAPATDEHITIQGDQLETRDGRTQVRGHVAIKYQDYQLRSDRAELDENREWTTFEDNVELEAPSLQARGSRLRFNLETEDWTLDRGRVRVEPEYLAAGLQEPFFLNASEVISAANRIAGQDVTGTSCDLEPGPHYALRSGRVTMIPDKRVTFAKPELYLFGHRLFRFPWDLSLSLERQDNRFLPEVGVNDVEGYFAKFAFGYVLNETQDGFLKLHLTQKRGIGLGLDHLLEQRKQTAEISVFVEPSEGSMTGRLEHHLQFSKPFTSDLNVNWQRDSGYGLGSESLSGNLTLRYDTPSLNTMLGLSQSLSSTAYATSERTSTTLTHRQRLGPNEDFSLRAAMTRNSFVADQPADEELETELTYRRQGSLYDLDLQARKRYDLDGSAYTGDSGYYGLDETPDFAVTTDGRRLGLLRHLLGEDTRATLQVGRFAQHPDNTRVVRTGLSFELPSRSFDLTRQINLRTSARFRQVFTDDGAAQWIADLSADYTQKLGTWESRLGFDYSRPNGYSPLRRDATSPVSTLNLQVARVVPDRMRLNFSFGRDLHNDLYNDALLRSEFLLSPRNRLEVQTGYSVENSQWRPLNLRWIFANRASWWSAVTFNYNLDQSEISRLTTEVDWSPSDQWRVQFLGGYSGYGGFDQADVKITRDLHCLAAQLTYTHATGELLFGLGIKAFPSNSRTFGVGGRGQFFESNFGDQY